jgi:hypothetical protein
MIRDQSPSYVVSISDDALSLVYATEQRLNRAAKAHQIIAAVAGGLLCGSILVVAIHSLFGA